MEFTKSISVGLAIIGFYSPGWAASQATESSKDSCNGTFYSRIPRPERYRTSYKVQNLEVSTC